MSRNVALKNNFNVSKRSIRIFLMSQNVAGDCPHVALENFNVAKYGIKNFL